MNGAVAGDTVIATPMVNGIEDPALSWNAFVSAANTVVIRVCNAGFGSTDVGAQTWRVDVWRH